MHQNNIIPFPIRVTGMNPEEKKELESLRRQIKQATTLREIRILEKKVKKFIESFNKGEDGG